MLNPFVIIGTAVSKAKKYANQFLTTGATPKGSWDASTNTPTLVNGSGTQGWYYDVIVAGTQLGYDFLVGDRVLYADGKWQRVATGVEQDNSPMVVAFVAQTTASLPTQRASGKPLVIGDTVKVKSTATLPFTISGITFDSYSDEAEWNGTAWQEKSYSAGKTNEVRVNNPTNESISGSADYQDEINEENANIIGKNKILSVSNKDNIIDALNYLAQEDDRTIERDSVGNLRFKVKTSADETKVWRVKNDGTWDLLFVKEWLPVATFNGLTPNDHTLYILTENITISGTEYKKGFYTWDSTNGYVARSSVVEVDDITIDKDANGKLEVKDNGLEVKHIKTTAKTETITNDNTKVALSNAVYKEILDNATSDFDYVDTGATDKINIELKNNNGATKIDKEIDFNDKLVLETKTQTITNKTIDADDNTVENLETDNFKNSALAKSTDNVRNYDASVDTKVATEKFIQKSLQNVFDPVNNNDATNKKYVDDELSKLSGKVMKFKGFVSSTEPVGTITEGSFWYEGSSLPTAFPINVKTYTNGAWSATTTEYSPTTLDLWSDINTGKGYYWFGNGWNLIDENVLVDDYTINKDNLGNLQLKPQTSADKGKVWQVGDDGSFILAHTSGIIEVEDLPTSDIRTDVVYHLNTPRRVLHNTSVVTNFVGYRSLSELIIPTSEGIDVAGSLLGWDEIQDTFITDAISQNTIEECSYADMDFGKYADNGYDFKSTFSETEPVSIYYVYDNGWLAITNLSIDSHIISDETTRQDLQLVGEDDIHAGTGTPKAQGIDIFLGQGNTPDPDIIQDGQNYRYAPNKTSSNYYLNTRLDTIQAQAEGSNKTYFIDYPDTLPVAGSRTLNAYYYIQIASGGNVYQRYFIDSTDVSHNLGTTEVDLSTLVPKTDIVVPDVNSTSGKVADAKGVYDNYAPISGSYAHANNSESVLVDDGVFDFHYQTNNNRSSETKLYSNARMIHPISRAGYIYGLLRTTQTLKTSAIVVFIQEFTESINGNTSGLLSFRRVGVLDNTGWNLVVSNKANIVWQDWQPINYNYAKKGYSSAFNLSVCLWDIPVDGTDSVISERRMFTNVSFTCPITNTTKYYRVETTIDCSGTTASGRASLITIVATRITSAGVTSPEVLKRVGLLSYDATNVPDVSKVFTYRANIVWKSWYPVEYPQTNFTLDTTKATTNTCSYIVSGSNLFIRMTGLVYTTSSTNETIGNLPAGLYSVIKGRNPILAGYESNGVVRTMYIEVTNGDIKVNTSTGGTALTNALQVYTAIPLGY